MTQSRSNCRCGGHAAHGHTPHAGCLRHPHATLFYRACRRHQDCHCRKRRFRYVAALFGQLSGKPLLACIWSHGVRGAKRNGRSKIKCWAPSWRNAVVQLVNWLGGRRRKRFEFNRAALIRLEGERISQLLISLIGAIEHENRSEA
jgi:hypothetical protein